MTWEKISDKYIKGKIPIELKPYLKENCPECGKPRVGNDKLTEVKCINYSCIKYVVNRAKDMFDFFGVKDIGPKGCERLLRTYELKSHMDLIPIKFKDKPNVYLWQIAKLTCIPGYSDKLEKVFAGYSTFEEYYSNEKDIPPILITFKDRLMKYEDYFKLKPALSKDSVIVMITGHINGYQNKESYVAKCNELFGTIIKTEMKKSVRANFLITDNPESGTDKLDIARKRGIPILTPKEYMVYLLYKTNPSNKALGEAINNLIKERKSNGN